MVNGRAIINPLRSSNITLQYTCEDCAGYGNQPISEEEVVSCSTCNGAGWTDLPNNQDLTIKIVRGL
tara:strand:+ start:324 stop:524 length:201 start_codon:yes stop_codon:yes gene_type:complete